MTASESVVTPALAPLPRPPTAFVGRGDELAAVLDQLADGVRLVTLTGLGGVGKTRLALAVGAALADRGVPVGYCDAVAVHSVPELAMALAAALDLEMGGLDRATPQAAVGLALARARRGKMLLIVDNFEHIAQLGGDVLVDLLSRSPGLQIVVTSRVALARPEELALPVQPMRADTLDSPAVELLAARARGGPDSPWSTDRAALQRLAARLDGLPLALELAAARAQLIRPDELLALLDERLSLTAPGAASNPRRGSRDAAVAWSWDQLGVDRRQALGRLAVLGGSFDLDLAASVVGGSRGDALDVLEVLSRYSLLAAEHGHDGVRYRVLETVRDFARTQIDDAALEAAHAAIAQALLARVEPHLSAFSRELPPAILVQVSRDRDLYLAVLRRGLDAHGLPALVFALRVAVALVPLLKRNGFGPVATAWTTELLSRPEIDQVPLPIRLGAALVTVVSAASAADTDVIDPLLARVAGWLKSGGNAFLVTSAFGIVHYHRWDHVTLLSLADSVLRSEFSDKSAELYGYALAAQVSSRRALGRAVPGDDQRLADALARLAPENLTTACLIILTRAFLAIHQGDSARGIALTEEGLARSGGAVRMFDALFHLERGRGLHDLGRLTEADAELSLALSMFDVRGSQRERQETLLDRAMLLLEMGRYDAVAEALAETQPALGTSFERAWHAAITNALAALTAGPPADPAPPTGTVEDGACDVLSALINLTSAAGLAQSDASIAAAPRAHGEASAAHTFRARRALRIFDAAQAIAAHQEGDAIAIALEHDAFRAGASWVDLSTRPLIRTLLQALVEAHMAGLDGVDREQLAARLWPDERVNVESRDQRLFTAVSTLRRLGLDEVIEAHDGGYRIAPSRTVLRVAVSAWPGVDGEVQRARGRGRPRKADA